MSRTFTLSFYLTSSLILYLSHFFSFCLCSLPRGNTQYRPEAPLWFFYGFDFSLIYLSSLHSVFLSLSPFPPLPPLFRAFNLSAYRIAWPYRSKAPCSITSPCPVTSWHYLFIFVYIPFSIYLCIPYSFLHTFFLSLCLLLVMWFRNLHQVRLTQIESCDLVVPVPTLLSRFTLALSSLVASCAIGRETRKKNRQKGEKKKSLQRLKVNSISAFISFSLILPPAPGLPFSQLILEKVSVSVSVLRISQKSGLATSIVRLLSVCVCVRASFVSLPDVVAVSAAPTLMSHVTLSLDSAPNGKHLDGKSGNWQSTTHRRLRWI